mgnify:CR=1 FL=1
MFTKMQEKDSQLVLYGETAAKIRETAKQFGVEDQLLLIEKERLDLSNQMEKYLDSFDGYLYAGNEVRIVRSELEWNFWEKIFL